MRKARRHWDKRGDEIDQARILNESEETHL